MARIMKAAEFKAKCLEVMDEVAATGEPVVVTKRGKPVARVTPVVRKPKTLRGFLKGSVREQVDIVGPIETDWNADRP
jgi:prevent-host-death family protein